jgi:hypothetical protein
MATRITPETVIKALARVGVKCLLMGTHGIGGWRSQARATQDVEILVKKKDHAKAIQALSEAFPRLIYRDAPVVSRFLDPTTQEPVIDVMKPVERLYQVAFNNAVRVGNTHFVPDLELALVSKYVAMISPFRPEDKKYIDAGDFINMVKTNHKDIDIKKLRRLGELIYKGGGAELLRYVEDAKTGRRLEI